VRLANGELSLVGAQPAAGFELHNEGADGSDTWKAVFRSETIEWRVFARVSGGSIGCTAEPHDR
jgi:hypothetical protein